MIRQQIESFDDIASLTTEYAASSLATGPTCYRSFRRQKTNEIQGWADHDSTANRSALMSGLRHSSNIPMDGHVSAHGMPDRPRVIAPRAVLRGEDIRA
jgi:hypothetical protein